MKKRVNALIVGAALLSSSAFAETAAATQCPPGKPLRAPDFPVEMAKRSASGSVLLDVTIDSCGRVLAATVKRPDQPAFNKAALASVEGVTLPPALRDGAVDGHVELPIDFKYATLSYQKVDWPTTHKRPRYVLDTEPMGFATAEEANTAIKVAPDFVWPSPYAVRSRFVQIGGPGAREFWLFVSKDGAVNLAAHYRPVLENGEPVVKLALLCSDTAEACAKARDTLMEGLPYAKAKRR